nr:HYD1 signature containing ADP-ribosyltransferase family protein [Streptomyces curacoi]
MADAMRELADAFDEHAGEAVGAVNRLLSSSEGWAVEALQEHWGKVKTSHLEQLPEVARLFADAMDVVADVIYGMKIKAEVELGVMAASVGVSIGLAFVTGGLSALIGAAEIAAMREVVRRIIKEAADQIVDQVMAMVTEPVAAKLEKMVTDAVLDLAAGAISPAEGSGGGGGKGAAAMQLNSAGGSAGGGSAGPAGGGGGAGRMRIDHGEYDKAAGHLGRLSETSLTRLSGSLDRAAGANSRTRGKDPFTQGIDSVVDGATKGMKKAVERIIKHTGETIPKNLRDTSENHKRNEKANEDALKKIMGDQDGKGGPGSPAKGPGSNGGPAGTKPDLLNKALNDPRHHSVEPKNRTCKGDPVDVASGQMLLQQTDLTLPGVLPLVLRRTHLSDYTFGTWFGRSWASTLDERIEVDIRNKAVWAREDGTLLVYDRLPTPQQPEVLPVEGPRIPLRRTSELGAQHMEFATTDPRTGWTKYFTRPRGEGWQLWLTTIEDRNGNQIDIHRDGTGLPLSITHSGGYDVRLTTDRDLGRITHLSLHTGPHADDTVQVMAYGYDPTSGDLTEVTNSSGQPLRFDYDAEGRITAWTDRNDSTYRYVHDAAGRVVETIGPDGYLSGTFVYDTTHRTTRWTDALGHTTLYQLDHRGQIIAETNPLGHTTRQTFDTRDQLLTRTDPLGRTTIYTWDDASNLLARQQADGSRTSFTYNELGLLVSIQRPDGTVTFQEFDESGNRTSVTNHTGATTRFIYDDRGRLTTVVDALGATTRVRCDAVGLLIEAIDPLGAVTRCERDAFGRQTTITDPLGATTRLEWTVEGKLARRTRPDGTVEAWTYDGEGNCLTHTDAMGAISRYEYTHFDLLAARTGPDGVRYTFTHDTELRLAQVTNPQGLTWSYEYDPAGRLIAETDFDNRQVTYTHDAAGQLTAITTASGQAIRFDRDLLGRVVRKEAAGAVTTYTYDATGGLAQATNSDATLTLRRDDMGRLTSETVNGRTLSHTYDALGRRTSRTTPTGATSKRTYDAAGNRITLTTAGRTLTFAHDAAGRELACHIGETLTLTNLYDAVGRLTGQELTGPADQPLRHRTYTYRGDGNLTGIDGHPGSNRRFDLDAAGRVTAVRAPDWTESYTYDTAGNQIHASWPDFMPGQEATGDRAYTGTRITRAGSVRYEHDAAGRITLRQKTRLSRNPETWRYTWDAEDRLTSVITPDGTTWRYRYDPLGRRIAKQRLAADGETVAEQTDFTWDGTTLAEQTTHTPGTAQPDITLTWDHQGLRPIAQTERKTLADAPQEDIDQRFFAIITDLVGTPTELVDEHGNIAWRTRSTLWGNTAWNRTATAYTPLRFPGQYHDPETGLHYNYFRHYDPESARYVTPDPLGLTPAPNPATYVENPHTESDPLGLAPEECPYRVERVADEDLGTLYHYTNEKGYDGILESGEMRASLRADNSKDARFGDGQYFTDIQPGTKTPGQLSYAFVRVPWAGHKFSHYIEIDVRGLEVMRSVERPDVYVIPNQGALDLTGRIVSHGKS